MFYNLRNAEYTFIIYLKLNFWKLVKKKLKFVLIWIKLKQKIYKKLKTQLFENKEKKQN